MSNKLRIELPKMAMDMGNDCASSFNGFGSSSNTGVLPMSVGSGGCPPGMDIFSRSTIQNDKVDSFDVYEMRSQ
jgi:hypothetical protein